MVVSDPLRPNSTDVNPWAVGDHTAVDEVVTQPDAGGSDYWAAAEAGSEDNEVITMGFPNTIDDVDEVTNITVWTNLVVVGNNFPEVYITGEAPVDVGATGWHSNSFDISWNQAELDALQVSYVADVPDKTDTNQLDVVYVIVTYTVVVVNWAHKFIGVVGASIGKASGVAIGSIATIKGVVI